MSRSPTLANRSWLVLGALSLGLGLAFQGSRGLWYPDEGRYAECAREMLVTGDWTTPRLSGSVHFTKPPLTYWAIAIGLRLLGMNEWGARLYLVFAFVGTSLIVWALGARMWNHKTGFLAGLIYATMVLPFAAANAVTTDPLLTFWETSVICCFWYAFTKPRHASPGWWIAGMWAAAGAAFLTKGPPGLLPLAAIAAFVLVQRGSDFGLRTLINLPGLVLFVAIGFTWYAHVVNIHEGLLSYLLRNELLARFAGTHERNPEWYKGIVIYLPTILLGTLPWSVTWPLLWSRWKRGRGWRERWREWRGSSRLMFLSVWFALPMAIFMVIPSRLVLYALPVFPALALATARGLVRHFHTSEEAICFRPGKRIMIAVAAWGLILLTVKIAAVHVPSRWDERALWTNIRQRLKTDEVPVVGGNARRHGVTFYSDGEIEMLEWGHRLPPPLSTQEKVLGKRIEELARSRRPYAVLTRPRHRQSLRRFVTRAGYRSRIIDLDQENILILCRPVQRGKRK